MTEDFDTKLMNRMSAECEKRFRALVKISSGWIWEEGPRDFHALVTDQTMPDLTGTELV